MFSARGVALNVTVASEQVRVLQIRGFLSARLKLRGTNSSKRKQNMDGGMKAEHPEYGVEMYHNIRCLLPFIL
jgi:hypothetical protein